MAVCELASQLSSWDSPNATRCTRRLSDSRSKSESTGGRFKGSDPTIATEDLERKWVNRSGRCLHRGKRTTYCVACAISLDRRGRAGRSLGGTLHLVALTPLNCPSLGALFRLAKRRSARGRPCCGGSWPSTASDCRSRTSLRRESADPLPTGGRRAAFRDQSGTNSVCETNRTSRTLLACRAF